MESMRQTLKVKKERAILVAATIGNVPQDGLAELTSLAETAGGWDPAGQIPSRSPSV